ncbi:hypothetical protein [Amycolatopsis sp. cmx-4-61]|uniref:hypothetical protein n=1 Tax=Amycolatopsis sp. cmx-4-61 TaxID=2790937 RepID=UPI003979B392
MPAGVAPPAGTRGSGRYTGWLVNDLVAAERPGSREPSDWGRHHTFRCADAFATHPE